MARFELPPQYCGLFENFSQFTDLLGRDFSEVETPGLRWIILVNKRPLYPYVRLEHIVNPWGYGSFSVAIRLDENATVEFFVRNTGYTPDPAEPEREIKRDRRPDCRPVLVQPRLRRCHSTRLPF